MSEVSNPLSGGPAPCDDCALADICALGFACSAFTYFVAIYPSGDCRQALRVPSRKTFRGVFDELPAQTRALNADERRRLTALRANAGGETPKPRPRSYANGAVRIASTGTIGAASTTSATRTGAAHKRASRTRGAEKKSVRPSVKNGVADTKVRIQTTTSEKSLDLPLERGPHNPRTGCVRQGPPAATRLASY
jgi:hypothetical protein